MIVVDADMHLRETEDAIRAHLPDRWRRPILFPFENFDRSLRGRLGKRTIDAAMQLRDMDEEGIDLAIVYPTLGLFFGEVREPDFAVALARKGITVNAISPGWTEDSVLNTLPPQAQDLIRNWHKSGWTPMGRLGTPADVGNVARLLCSEDAGWITGQVIYADGGASLMNPEVPPEIQLG